MNYYRKSILVILKKIMKRQMNGTIKNKNKLPIDLWKNIILFLEYLDYINMKLSCNIFNSIKNVKISKYFIHDRNIHLVHINKFTCRVKNLYLELVYCDRFELIINKISYDNLYLKLNFIDDKLVESLIRTKNIKVIDLSKIKYFGKFIKNIKKIKNIRLKILNNSIDSKDLLLLKNTNTRIHISNILAINEEKEEININILNELPLENLYLDCRNCVIEPNLKELDKVNLKYLNIINYSKKLDNKNFISLEKLCINNNKSITDDFFKYIYELKNLKILSLKSCNYLTFKKIYDYGELPIEKIELYECLNIRDNIFKLIANMKKLVFLKMFHCPRITGKYMDYLKNSKIGNLEIKNCQNIDHDALYKLQYLPLTNLVTDCRNFNDIILSKLRTLKLRKLNIEGCDVTSLYHLKNMPLYYLNINGCSRLKGQELGNLNKETLKYLYMSKHPFSSESCKNLREFYLDILDITNSSAPEAIVDDVYKLKSIAKRFACGKIFTY